MKGKRISRVLGWLAASALLAALGTVPVMATHGTADTTDGGFSVEALMAELYGWSHGPIWTGYRVDAALMPQGVSLAEPEYFSRREESAPVVTGFEVRAMAETELEDDPNEWSSHGWLLVDELGLSASTGPVASAYEIRAMAEIELEDDPNEWSSHGWLLVDDLHWEHR